MQWFTLSCWRDKKGNKFVVNLERHGYFMINFDEEIKKFKPNLEVDEAEEAIYKNENASDVADLIDKLVNGVTNDELF